jgi:predicted dehydrogenase
MGNSNQVGVALIGAGYWGKNYVRLLVEHPDTRLVCVCDEDLERLAVVRNHYPDVFVTANIEDLLDNDDVSMVVVCTPVISHYHVAKRCLDAGKHVLVEKPLAATSEQAQKLVDIAETNHLTLMVGHIFLYNSGIQQLKQYIDQGEIGETYYIHARRTNLGPIRQDVNALWDLATHDISILNYLLDEIPSWVSAVGRRVLNSHREDVGFVTLNYPSGVLGHIHASWAEPDKVRDLVVVGSKKRIMFNDANASERLRIYAEGVESDTNGSHGHNANGADLFTIHDGDIIIPRVKPSEPLKNQVEHFITCALTGQRPLSDGQSGLDVVRVLEAIDRSMMSSGAPAQLTPRVEKMPIQTSLERGKRDHYSINPLH